MVSIKIENLTKFYGVQKVLDGIHLEVNEGEIVGFLGPNGAGKSTTMKILTGFLPASSGSATILNFDINTQSNEAKKNIGYLPEHNPLYLEMYVKEFLEFIGSLYGMRGSKLKKRISELIDLVGLNQEQSKKIRELSKGYRQRVGLAQALIHDPKVLILDEPTTGLDPNQITEIRSVIKEAGKNKAVLFSSHIMQEVEAICDRVIIIHKGKIVASGTLSEIKAKGNSLEEVFRELTQ
ncbi:MAG: ATP-binding cassette domain-containing protein [Bacteroidota bacterium]